MKRSRQKAYIIIGAIPIGFLAIMTFLNPSVLITPLGWGMIFAVVIVSNLGVSYGVGKIATAQAQKITDVFEQECNPKTFLDEAEPIAQEILAQVPFKSWGAWFLAIYCNALIDQGKTTAANNCLIAIGKSAQKASNPTEKFEIVLTMIMPTKELSNNEAADKCLQVAENLIAENSKLEKHEGITYISWCRSILSAETAHDEIKLTELYQQTYSNPYEVQRMRIWAAYKAANLYKNLGEKQKEKECLELVVSKGNTMGCVEEAKRMMSDI